MRARIKRIKNVAFWVRDRVRNQVRCLVLVLALVPFRFVSLFPQNAWNLFKYIEMKYAGKCLYIKQHEATHSACLGRKLAGAEREVGTVGMANATRSAGTSRAYGDEMKLVNLLKVR